MSVNLLELARTDFRTSRTADDINTRFQTLLGLRRRYEPARLAIGRSLALNDEPDISPVMEEDYGKPIKGENLFGTGGDLATWVALVVEHAQRNGEITKKDVQSLVSAHWHRGINLLWEEWKGCGNDFDNFLIQTMERAGLPEGSGDLSTILGEETSGGTEAEPVAAPIDLPIGDPATDLKDNQPVSWRINARGNSPHIGMMGTLGTGKTRLAMQMVRQVHQEANAAVLMFDMGKGDLSEDQSLLDELGAQVIRCPKDAVPLDVMSLPDESDTTVNDVALRFRESFSRVAKSRPGGAQSDAIREAARRALLRKQPTQIPDVRDALHEVYEEKNRKEDAVTAQFNDLCLYELFRPELSIEQFLKKSWIIDVHEAPETVQRLIVFMIMDAVDTYLARLRDAPMDSEYNRAMRLMMVVDEARKVLGYKHDSLVNIVRTSRSKGGSVMLISQSPDDFAQEDENFLENIGLAVCFRTNAKSSALNAVFQEKVDLAGLPNGVCVTRLPEKTGVRRIQAWQ